MDGTTDAVTLGPGQYAVNPPGTWHTADIGDIRRKLKQICASYWLSQTTIMYSFCKVVPPVSLPRSQ